MATLSTQVVNNTGLEPSYASATVTTGDRFVPGPRTFLHIVNGGGSPITATITTPNAVDGDLAVADRTITIPNGSSRFIAVPENLYRASDGLGTVICSSVTSVTIAVIRI